LLRVVLGYMWHRPRPEHTSGFRGMVVCGVI